MCSMYLLPEGQRSLCGPAVWVCVCCLTNMHMLSTHEVERSNQALKRVSCRHLIISHSVRLIIGLSGCSSITLMVTDIYLHYPQTEAPEVGFKQLWPVLGWHRGAAGQQEGSILGLGPLRVLPQPKNMWGALGTRVCLFVFRCGPAAKLNSSRYRKWMDDWPL